MNQPDISIVIPVYNRGDLIRYTLESVRRASAGLAIETIIVDDGSTIPVVDELTCLGYAAATVIRQQNRGLLFARLTGFAAATGRYIQFLDSDDLVSSEKFRAQITAMDAMDLDVSYTDSARCTLDGDYDRLAIAADSPVTDVTDAAEFFIAVQPPPHSPIFRTDYLRQVVAQASFPPSPLYNPVAEIWFYHVAAPQPARIRKVTGPHAIVGVHPGSRLTTQWEKLGVASLAVMEAFARTCTTDSTAARAARQQVGEKAFRSWRRLPRGFSEDFARRTLDLWRRLASEGQPAALGGPIFQMLARVLGPQAAARFLHRFQSMPYVTCRTISDAQMTELLAGIPSP